LADGNPRSIVKAVRKTKAPTSAKIIENFKLPDDVLLVKESYERALLSSLYDIDHYNDEEEVFQA